MSFTADPRRLRGVLTFLTELEAVARQCAETGVWDDEFTARRRQRVEAPSIAKAAGTDPLAKAR